MNRDKYEILFYFAKIILTNLLDVIIDIFKFNDEICMYIELEKLSSIT